MSSPGRLCMLAIIAFVAAPASAARADDHAHFVGSTHTVTAMVDTTEVNRSAELKCPEGTFLLRSDWRTAVGYAKVERTDSSSGTVFKVYNIHRGERLLLRMEIECADKFLSRSAAHRHGLGLTVTTEQVEIPAGSRRVITGTCPTGWFPISGAYTGVDSTFVGRSMPVANRWTFDAFNMADEPAKVTTSTSCLGERTTRAQRRKRRHRHRLRHRVVSQKVQVPSSPMPRVTVISVPGKISCPSGYVGTGQGFVHQGHPFTYLGTFIPTAGTRIGSKFDFEIFNQSTEQTDTLAVVCVGRKTGPPTAAR